MCKPPQLLSELFSKLQQLPAPMPDEDGHYEKFEKVFEKKTVEDHRPFLHVALGVCYEEGKSSKRYVNSDKPPRMRPPLLEQNWKGNVREKDVL